MAPEAQGGGSDGGGDGDGGMTAALIFAIAFMALVKGQGHPLPSGH